jgi:exodeoxyribonuclease VII large subunit
MYLSLKDEKCQIRAVMFRPSAKTLRFEPEDGQKVIVRGRVSVYEPRGDYQLILDHMEPAGIGALQLAFLKLREKLEKEGLFASERKRPVPALPRRIGVVTSPAGAAVRDFLNVVKRRFSNMDILISPASVQGDSAAPEIVAAIEALNEPGRVDVIVVTRGGGSIEDLWAFNTEAVARAIAGSAIPVISAVGHEVDFTIADFVADLRAPTPSAAAEIIVKSKENQSYLISTLGLRLERAIRSLLSDKRARVASEMRVLPDPVRVIRELGQRLDDLANRITMQTRSILELTRKRVENPAGRLAVLNPLAILARGYSITTVIPGTKMLTDASRVSAGDRIATRLKNGTVHSEVIRTYPQESLFDDEEESGG